MAKKIIDPDALKRQTKYDDPWTLVARELNLLGKQASRVKQFRMVFTLDKLAYPNIEDIKTGKIEGYNKLEFTFDHYKAGLYELRAILEDSTFMEALLKRVYSQTILQVLKTRLGKRSLERRGSGASYRTTSLEEVGKKRKARELKFFSRSVDELGEKWKRVYDIILSPAKLIAPNTIQGFTLQQLLSINMESENSDFTNVYMMAEFGTGQVVKPNPRRFISKTVTPYKVSPLLAAFGGNTSWWFSVKKSRVIAQSVLKARSNIIKSKRSKKAKLEAINALATRHLFDFAMGAPGPRSIAPRNVIFDSRGMVIQLREAYEEAYRRVSAELNGLIAKKIPSWPPNLITLPFNPFPIPKTPKIVG